MIIFTCLLTYEHVGQTFRRTTSESLVSHAYGALKLLEYRGPQSHMFGLDHYCFAELRPYWVSCGRLCLQPLSLYRVAN